MIICAVTLTTCEGACQTAFLSFGAPLVIRKPSDILQMQVTIDSSCFGCFACDSCWAALLRAGSVVQTLTVSENAVTAAASQGVPGKVTVRTVCSSAASRPEETCTHLPLKIALTSILSPFSPPPLFLLLLTALFSLLPMIFLASPFSHLPSPYTSPPPRPAIRDPRLIGNGHVHQRGK